MPTSTRGAAPAKSTDEPLSRMVMKPWLGSRPLLGVVLLPMVGVVGSSVAALGTKPPRRRSWAPSSTLSMPNVEPMVTLALVAAVRTSCRMPGSVSDSRPEPAALKS